MRCLRLSKSLRLLLFFFFFFFTVVVQAVDLSEFPPCNMPACNVVAEKGKWPSPNDFLKEEYQQIRFNGFQLSLPAKAVAKNITSYSQQYDLGEGAQFSLSVFKREDMDEFFKASQYQMPDWADIVFTQTPKGKTPETEAEAYAWYSALMTKVVFVANNKITQFIQPKLIAYWINNSRSNTSTVMVVSHRLPEVLLKIEITAGDERAALALISGLSLHERLFEL